MEVLAEAKKVGEAPAKPSRRPAAKKSGKTKKP